MRNVLISVVSAVCLCFFCACSVKRPPVKISMRSSWVRGGVLQISNHSSDQLVCSVYVRNNTSRSKTFRFVLNPNCMQEVGYLELDGWYLDPGEYAIISVEGYAIDLKVKWNSPGDYHVEDVFL